MRRAHKQIPPIFIGLRRPGALLKNRPWTPQNFCLGVHTPQGRSQTLSRRSTFCYGPTSRVQQHAACGGRIVRFLRFLLIGTVGRFLW